MGHEGLKEYSRKIQDMYFEWIEKKEFDVLSHEQFKHFKKILSNYFQSNNDVNKLAKTILPDERCFWYRIVLVNCSEDGKYFSYPVISVRESDGHIVFYDMECRRYEDWNDFLTNNRLPKCLMRYPRDGVYKKRNNWLELEEKESPACGVWNGIREGAYLAAKFIAIVTSVAADFKSLEPYNQAIAVVSGIANGYIVGDHGLHLYDRAKHGQSISYSDPEAKRHWNSMGRNTAFFFVTLGQIQCGTPQSDQACIQNLMNMCKIFTDECVVKGCASSLEKMQCIIMDKNCCYLYDGACEFIDKNIIRSVNVNADQLIRLSMQFVLKDNFSSEKFRRMVEVDGNAIATVANDVAFSKRIPKLLHSDLFHISCGWTEVVDNMMVALKSWVDGNTTLRQLNFRIYKACVGSKAFENIEEMCKCFNARTPEDVQIDGKYLFRGSGEIFLNFFKEHCGEDKPELLSCIVEYLGEGKGDDISSFKKFWHKKIMKQCLPHPSLQVSPTVVHWMNAVNLENLSYTCSVPPEGSILVRPREGNFNEITVEDLYKLAKKLLGRVGDVEMQMVRADVDWVVVASKKCGFTVIIGPKIRVKHAGSMNESYPVFKRPLL
ncbi:uncharacterized protein LOC124154663 [Ischnura elegans]|uniref:uncharacterized protein LOC124154663 n=1 Tax=Ischnura elegans TaxID=197161 RepID=UPI001ED87D5C|nr:uncharacterized protein LOC124154663 [Ischnura elegans]